MPNLMFLGIPYIYWTVACLLIAVFYAIKWPRPQSTDNPVWLRVPMRWFHSLVWVFLAIGAFLYWNEMPTAGQWALRFALLLYALFIAATMLDRRRAERQPKRENGRVKIKG